VILILAPRRVVIVSGKQLNSDRPASGAEFTPHTWRGLFYPEPSCNREIPCRSDKKILRDQIDDRERVPAQDQKARSRTRRCGPLRTAPRQGQPRNAAHGSHKTTLKDLRKEIGTGLFNGMLTQLGLSWRDFDE
jgi:hypothetical protein